MKTTTSQIFIRVPNKFLLFTARLLASVILSSGLLFFANTFFFEKADLHDLALSILAPSVGLALLFAAGAFIVESYLRRKAGDSNCVMWGRRKTIYPMSAYWFCQTFNLMVFTLAAGLFCLLLWL